MTPKQVKDIFDKLPSKRRKVLVGFLAGHSREKIMIDADVPSDAALTGHLKELYKNFRIVTGWNDADDPRSGTRKLPSLIALFAKYMPELISDRIPDVLDDVEQEEAIAPLHGESREAVNVSASDLRRRYFKEVQEIVYAGDGEISLVDRIALDALGKHLGLIAEDTAAIEDEILQPFQTYKKKLQQYEQELVEIIQHEYPLSNQTKYYLERLQHSLKLRNKDVEQITAQIVPFNELDFTKLRDLLVGGKWKDADQETFALMLNAVGREEGSQLTVEDIEKFPYPYLHTIDQLWIRASNGRFGFSVQKGIWHSLGGTSDANGEIYRCFSERVGWRVEGDWLTDDELTYSINAPVGHLPVFLWCGLFGEMDEDVWGDAGCRRLVGYSVALDGVEVSHLFSRMRLPDFNTH